MSEFINESDFEPEPSGFTYVCVGCKVTFERKQKLDTARFEPRCPTCHAAFRKASKRATWRKHATEYRTRQTEAQKQAERAVEIEPDGNETEIVPARQSFHESPKPTQNSPKKTRNVQGRPIFRTLPGGRRIVWMADDLISAASSAEE